MKALREGEKYIEQDNNNTLQRGSIVINGASDEEIRRKGVQTYGFVKGEKNHSGRQKEEASGGRVKNIS